MLHVITTIARGGAENHLVDLIHGQLAQGWTVKVAYLKDFGDHYWRQHLTEIGVETFYLGLRLYGQLIPALSLRRTISRVRPDIVHAHMPPAELYTRLALIGRPQVPLIISKHNDKSFLRNSSGKEFEQWCAGRASRIIGISGAVTRFFDNRWPRSIAGNLTTIQYGLDANPYKAVTDREVATLRGAWGVSAGEVVVGTVARLNCQKALDIMIRGFGLARQQSKTPLRLVIIGRGELEADLKELAASLGLNDHVVFGGFRTDIPAVMRSFDVFALTSDFEGFGLVLLEAMSASRPVLATAVSAIPEVVADGETGVLVPPQSPGSFAKALVELLDPTRRRILGEAGLQRVETQFLLATMVDTTLRVYEETLATHHHTFK